jgi:hypothetical protein
MTEALELEVDYTPQSLIRLFEMAHEMAHEPARNRFRERRRRSAERATILLRRVPNYFEEAATIAKAGSLEASTSMRGSRHSESAISASRSRSR